MPQLRLVLCSVDKHSTLVGHKLMKQTLICSLTALISVSMFTSCSNNKESITVTNTTASSSAAAEKKDARETSTKKKSDSNVSPSPTPAG